LVYENVYMVISLPTKRISVISQWKTFIRVLPTRWRRKPAGIEFTSLLPYADITCSELCSIVKFEFDQSFYSTTNATSRLCAIHGHVSMCVWCVFYCLSVTSRCSIQRATDIITQNSIPHKSDIKRFNWYCQTSCSVVTDTPTVHPNFTIAVNKTRQEAQLSQKDRAMRRVLLVEILPIASGHATVQKLLPRQVLSQVSAVANWPVQQNRAVDSAWRSVR